MSRNICLARARRALVRPVRWSHRAVARRSARLGPASNGPDAGIRVWISRRQGLQLVDYDQSIDYFKRLAAASAG